MSTSKYLNGNGLSEAWTNTKNYIASQLLGKSDVGHTHSASDITSGLSTVATSGSYNDLSNKPTIPTVNNATLTIQKNGTTVKTFTANASSNVTANISVPTKTSDLTNDSGFLTSHQSLSGYVPKSGGAVITGGKLGRTVNNGEFLLCGGTDWSDGSFISLHGQNFNDGANETGIGAGSQRMRMYPSGSWTWSGTAVQITSDQRLKQQIAEIDDKLLDAWEDVDLVQFKYNDAVKEKSDNARLHTGYVVQQIDEACKSHGVDISEYGLYCHEVYQEETREVEHEDGTKTIEVVRPASEHYSLRYTEALIVECAYLRKKLKELTVRIEQLESSK